MHIVWPDILIAAILLIALLKGFKRGFVLELAGAIALICALVTPWFYGGILDAPIQHTLHVGPGSAHVIGMFLVGVGTYLAIMLIARALNVVAKLPVLGLGNALAGGAVGIAKAAAGIWILLYVALLFPLSPDIRADLHRSALVHLFTQSDKRVDDAIIGSLPVFVRPLVQPEFDRHRV